MKLNRFYVLFILWGALLAWCITTNNVYVNAFALALGFVGVAYCIAYVTENMNESEKRFAQKLVNIF